MGGRARGSPRVPERWNLWEERRRFGRVGTRQGPSPAPMGPSGTRGGVVGSGTRGWWRQRREGCGAGPQGRDHLHDVGQHHVRGAERPAPLQRRPLRFLLHVDIGFDGDGFPAAGRVDGDLLVLRAEDGTAQGGSGWGGWLHGPSGVAQRWPQTDGAGTLTSGCGSGCPACTGPPPVLPAEPSYCRQGAAG